MAKQPSPQAALDDLVDPVPTSKSLAEIVKRNATDAGDAGAIADLLGTSTKHAEAAAAGATFSVDTEASRALAESLGGGALARHLEASDKLAEIAGGNSKLRQFAEGNDLVNRMAVGDDVRSRFADRYADRFQGDALAKAAGISTGLHSDKLAKIAKQISASMIPKGALADFSESCSGTSLSRALGEPDVVRHPARDVVLPSPTAFIPSPMTTNADIVEALHEQRRVQQSQHDTLLALIEEAQLAREFEAKRWDAQQEAQAEADKLATTRWHIELGLLIFGAVVATVAVVAGLWAAAHYAGS